MWEYWITYETILSLNNWHTKIDNWITLKTIKFEWSLIANDNETRIKIFISSNSTSTRIDAVYKNGFQWRHWEKKIGESHS